MAVPVPTSFVGGDAGPWAAERIDPIIGPSLPHVTHVAVIQTAEERLPPNPAWVLRGVVGQEHYTTRQEHEALARRQEPLSRPAASRAALIPVTKSQECWHLSQDERRA